MRGRYMRMKRIGILIALCIGCFFSTVQVWAAEAEYRIDVNITQNIVTVYRQGAGGVYTAERAFYCSTGAATPTGTYKTTNKYEWRALFGNVYGQYATRITGHILFHSVPYRTMAKDSLDTQAYNKLGTSASMGCIRLTVEDAKWIYDNCPSGTTVRMYKSDGAEPIIPQAPIILDTSDSRSGWDPTDPDKNNPWRTEIAEESVVSVVQIEEVAANLVEELVVPKEPAVSGGVVAAEEVAVAEEIVVEEFVGVQSVVFLINGRQHTTESIYRDGRFGLKAKEARAVFSHVGKTVVLPQSAFAKDDGELLTVYRQQRYTIPYWVEESGIYFDLESLCNMIDVSVSYEEPGYAWHLRYEIAR